MFVVSLVAGVVVGVFLLAASWFLGRRSTRHWVTAVLVAASLSAGALTYRYVAPWITLAIVMRTPGNPLYAIAQQNPDTAQMLLRDLYDAYLQGGETAMRLKAKEFGGAYVRDQNIFGALAQADDATIDEAFELFKIIVDRGSVSAPEKCGQFLSRSPGVTAADLGLTTQEKLKANETITHIISLPRPDATYAERPRLGAAAIRDIFSRSRAFEMFQRKSTDLTPAEFAERCLLVKDILARIDGLPSGVRVQALRTLFERMGT